MEKVETISMHVQTEEIVFQSFQKKETHFCIPRVLKECTNVTKQDICKNRLTWYALVESIIVTAVSPASGHPCYADSDTTVR